MDDRELLELAAKAVGHAIDPIDAMHEPEDWACWNPLTDDGDALRLAVCLKMDIHPDIDGCYAETSVNDQAIWASEFAHDGDVQTATRRAIVRAAAEIGKVANE